MSILNFIPEVWSANILTTLRAELVYAQAGLINRNYEGEIAAAGDTVHITSFNDPAVRGYTRSTDITWDLLTDAERALTINQADYFAFTVDDLDRRQALGGFIPEVSQGAGYNLSTSTDTYVSGLMAAGVDAGNKVTAVTVDSSDKAYALILALRAKLTKANVPASGRWVVVPTDLYSYLLSDARFINAAASGTTDTLRNGQVGRVLGFDVMESQTVPAAGNVYTILAGHGMATTFAEQIVKSEALRLQNQFGDGVRGLHVYGGKVIRPKALASCAVTI